MENRIEQEVNKTLECMGRGRDFRINPLFAEELSGRIAGIRISRAGYRSRIFYPVVIVLLVVLNFSAGLAFFTKQQPVEETSGNQVSVLASEYGISQSMAL